MGARIAERLGATLDIVLVRKLGAPFNPEFGLGAIDEDGLVTMSPDMTHLNGSSWLETETRQQLALIRERRARYALDRPLPRIAGRTVVVLDDGMATGVTMVAALDWVRRRGPAQLIAAVPVASGEAIDWARDHADRVICPWRPVAMGAVSEFYRDFPQVEDEQVVELLTGHASREAVQAVRSNSRM
jgi:putative phosphoribosyl transferase